MKNKNQITALSGSTIGSYGLLKLPQAKIDPYTRFTIGLVIGSAIVVKYADENPLALFSGIGIIIASALQLIDVAKGGRLSSNEARSKIYVLHESKGVVELKSDEVPNYNIDGFTYKGLNGVFKLSDGVYAGVNFNNDINVFGVGAIVNKLRKSGLKSKDWVDAQADKRWLTLYKKSFVV